MAFGLASCARPSAKDVRIDTVLTVDARTLAPGAVVDLQPLAREGGFHVEPVAGGAARPVRLVEVLAVDELLLDTDRGRERVRLDGLLGEHPGWPPAVNAWFGTEGRAALERWLREPDTWLVEKPAGGLAAGWRSTLAEHDADGLRVVQLWRGDAVVELEVRSVARAQGWAVGCTPWSDAAALSPGLLLSLSNGERGVHALPQMRALLEAYLAESREALKGDEAALTAWVAEEQARVAAALGWEPSEPASLHVVREAQAEAMFTVILTAYNAELQGWAEAELARLGARAEAAGDVVPETLELELFSPAQQARAYATSLDGYSPAGPNLYLVDREDSDRRALEHILVHELIHEYQEGRFERHGLFPSPGLLGNLLEPHAEWHAARIVRAGRPELAEHRGISELVHVRQFERLCAELELDADEVLARFYDDRFDAYRWGDVKSGELSLQEYLFHEHERTRFGPLDTRFSDSWLEDAVVVIANESDALVRAQFSGVWLIDVSEGHGEFATVRVPPCNVILPAHGELHLRISSEPILPEETALRLIGLYSPTPSAASEPE